MPELPETETIKQQLNKLIIGLTIREIEIRNSKSFSGNKEEIIGRKILSVYRYGKMICLELEGEKLIVIHLRMTGQLLYIKKNLNKKRDEQEKQNIDNQCKKDAYTRIIIFCSKEVEIIFRDVRKFGYLKIYNKEIFKENKQESGRDPFEADFTMDYLRETLKEKKRTVKSFLLNQKIVRGIGNIYANEILFFARIKPEKTANNLTLIEIDRLYKSIKYILLQGIKHKGTSIKDKSYRDIWGKIGSHQHYLNVYQREGQNCPNCRKNIKKIKIAGRGTWYCPSCQK